MRDPGCSKCFSHACAPGNLELRGLHDDVIRGSPSGHDLSAACILIGHHFYTSLYIERTQALDASDVSRLHL